MAKTWSLGELLKFLNVMRSIEHVISEKDGVPTQNVVIWGYGEIPEGADDGVSNFLKDGDVDFDTPVSDSKLSQENSTNDVVMSPILNEWPSFNKVEMGCSNYVLESTLAYLLLA
ncbi:hypothetical protein ACFE04_023522 [Oxalis oulophora]